jgi:hypothetical protein
MKASAGSASMPGLFLVNALALAAAVAWLARLTLPAAQAVRVRNAHLLRRGMASDFEWTPARVPQDFRQERASAPAEIQRAVNEAGLDRIPGDWARATALVGLLLRHTKADVPIRADLATTYAGIVNGGGYCSDFVRVYLAAARVAGLFCRQWAFSFDGFGGHGHTVVEVWDAARERWSMLDVHNNVYAVRSGEDVPLDALAVRHLLATAPAQLEFRPASDARLGFPDADKLMAYYRRGAREWYLWFGNDVVAREHDGVAGALSRLSGTLAHRVSSAFGRLPPIVVAVAPGNDVAIARMESLRRRVQLAAALVAVLAALLLLQGLRADA